MNKVKIGTVILNGNQVDIFSYGTYIAPVASATQPTLGPITAGVPLGVDCAPSGSTASQIQKFDPNEVDGTGQPTQAAKMARALVYGGIATMQIIDYAQNGK